MEEDRRENIRVDASFNFTCKVYKKTEQVVEISQVKNISVGGAQIVTKFELNTDNILELNFRTPQSKSKITLLGKVLESWSIPEKALYISRISFTYPNEVTQETMSALIKELKTG